MRVQERLAQLWLHRAWGACFGALLVTLVTLSVADDLLVRRTNYLVATYWLALLLLLPIRLSAVLLLGSLGSAWMFDFISTTKAEVTHLPLMAFDLRVVAVYPDGFLDAMKITGWRRIGLYTAPVVGIILLVAAVGLHVRGAYRRLKVDSDAAIRQYTVMTLAAVLVGAQAAVFLVRLPQIVGQSSYVSGLWAPLNMVELERRMGTLPFVYYSYILERSGSGNLLFDPDGDPPPDPAKIAASADRVLDIVPLAAGDLPNIVLVKVESTFDVNAAFHLTEPVRSLIYDSDSALAYGMLRVNAVGGGSWISEFESVTGIDSRMFGFSGYYTHAALSPYIKGSLVTWLRERGYRTAVYYPVEGSFQNVRQAYPRYGFELFLASGQLGLSAWSTPDSTIAAAYLRHHDTDHEPFFAFFVLNENHAPHACRNFQSPDDFAVRFAGTADFDLNCDLNEFVRNLASSERALRDFEDMLVKVEEQSGRPYLLVTYGDHQPHTFTGSGGQSNDYTPYRKPPDIRETFYRISGSAPTRIRHDLGKIPVTLLPTIISAFVAGTPQELYLGVNLLLLESCGIDPFASAYGDTAEGTLPSAHPGSESAGCATAAADAIASYRHAGIFTVLPSAQGARQVTVR
jgi:hypothetical protein